MAAPELPDQSLITQALIGAAIFFAAIAGQWRNFWKAFREGKEPAPSHLVLDAAELADMKPLRELSAQLQREFPILLEHSEKILEILERLDRERELEARMKDERLRDHMDQLRREAEDRRHRD
jgi:hypothetical protein